MAFPSTPANGTIYTSTTGFDYQYITDNGGWKKISTSVPEDKFVRVDTYQGYSSAQETQVQNNLALAFPLGPHKVTVHTASTTHNYDANTTMAMVEVIGGGGGGAGSNSGTTASIAGGLGGQAGGISVKIVDVANQSISSATITIGAGGSGGAGNIAAPGANGSSGGTSTYSDGTYTVTGVGGANGTARSASNILNGVPRNAEDGGTGGDWEIPTRTVGCSSGWGDNANIGATIEGNSSAGGDGKYGSGGRKRKARGSSSATSAGQPGIGIGAGGSGAASCHNGGNGTGGAGTAGGIIIWEFR